ncbi:MAG: C25 family cysteine peptidase [bacterium]
MLRQFIIIFTVFLFSSSEAKQWIEVNSSDVKKSSFTYQSNGLSSTEISFELSGYFLETSKNGVMITAPGGVSMLKEGAPDLPVFTTSIQIPDLAKMQLEVISSEYIDVRVESVIPSRGNITRDININLVPFKKGLTYDKNSFYPDNIAFLRSPYIIRTKRGQTVVFQPFQYNPIDGILRVHTNITISVKADGISTDNPLVRLPSKNRGMREMEEIYSRHFLNNVPTNDRYTPLDENGAMLIICYGPFIDAMQPFIDWKIKKGMHVELYNVDDIGDAADIKTFVEDYYYANGINFLLLVGDIAQVPSPRFSEGAGSNSPSDTYYGFIPSQDYYPDVFVGRFSAETVSHVNTMVNRTISYERYPDIDDGSWYIEGAGFASNEGPGDDGEYDNEHMDIIRQKLLDYNYGDIEQVYDPSGTIAEGEVAINDGLSIINYTGHGSNGSWGNGCPMNNTNVNSLTNTGMWPWIWSVACVNGEFHIGTCFAETWLRATDSNGQPTGAIATLMASVNQAWNPPMDGQDEMVDIFVESYENNIKRTFGGLSYNGCMEMNDNYGSQGDLETLYWNTFGDPSFEVRSNYPQPLDVSHSNVIILGSSELVIQTNSSEAVAALTKNGIILGVASANENGICQINLEEPASVPGSVNLVITSYNSIPYETEINVIAPDGSYMLLDDFSISNNNDEAVNFSDQVSLSVMIENVGTETSGFITTTLINQTDNVTVLSPSITIDSVLANQMLEAGPFEFEVSSNVTNQENVEFKLLIEENESSWEYPISLTANAPEYNMVSSSIFDGENGSLDPGENVSMQMVIENTGSAALHYPTFEVYENDDYISIEYVSSDNAYYWDVGLSVIINVNVSVSENAPVGHSSIAWLDIGSLNSDYESLMSIPLNIGMLMDNFESEGFSTHDWRFAGQNEWFIQGQEVFDGDFSIRSGAIGNNQTSEISVEYNVLNQGNINFFAKASSEQGNSGTIYDYLSFYIDNEQMVVIGGESDWDEYSFMVTPGLHTFRWVYEKDNAGSSGQDCAWLDNIIFPPGSIPPLNIDFGDLNEDDNINVLDVVLTVSSVLGYGDLTSDQTLAADINMDGVVNIIDVTMIIDMLFAD